MKAYILLAPGYEEIEVANPLDVLRRTPMETVVVSVTDSEIVKGDNGMFVKADALIGDVNFNDADWIVVPGGIGGSKYLAASEKVAEVLKEHVAKGKPLAAICHAPSWTLAPIGILDGKEATCYPGSQLATTPRVKWVDKELVELPGLITANGPEAAILFGLAIVKQAFGEELADKIANDLLVSNK